MTTSLTRRLLGGMLAVLRGGAATVTEPTETAEIANLSVKAILGYANAQYNLGLAYDNGQGVPQDDAQAVAWFRKAAEQGDANAQHNLGYAYANGQGVPQDNCYVHHHS